VKKKSGQEWDDNASCIMMSENPTNRDRLRHVDVKVHYLHDLVHDGHVKLVKCTGTQNVSDVLTKSFTRPAFQKHREHMWGTRVPFSAFFSTVETKIASVMVYNIKLAKFISSNLGSHVSKTLDL
jgi:hypothetical protein